MRGGDAGGASTPPKVLICWKSDQKHWKLWQNPWKSEQNPYMSRQKSLKIWTQMLPNVVWFQNLASNVCRNAIEDVFLERPRHKNVFIISWEKNLWANVSRQLLRKFWQKLFALSQICVPLHLCINTSGSRPSVNGVAEKKIFRKWCHRTNTFEKP